MMKKKVDNNTLPGTGSLYKLFYTIKGQYKALLKSVGPWLSSALNNPYNNGIF